jgi:hypothetical protein
MSSVFGGMMSLVGSVHPTRRKRAESIEVEVDGPRDTVKLSRLSEAERGQLGKPSNSRVHPSAKEWVSVRDFLWQKSVKRDPELKPEMTAYTPGENLKLMDQPAIRRWHAQMKHYRLPEGVMRVIFVPCAATKPWDSASSGIYASYNRLREEMAKGSIPSAFFVTVSEPLGIVPEDKWGSFPRYDDPGLFRNDSARAGRTTTREWLDTFGKNFVTPFDEEAYDKSIDRLSDVIAEFALNNARPGLKFMSFVDDADGVGTHTDMLLRANQKAQFLAPEDRHKKRSAPRVEPYGLIKKVLRREERLSK